VLLVGDYPAGWGGELARGVCHLVPSPTPARVGGVPRTPVYGYWPLLPPARA